MSTNTMPTKSTPWDEAIDDAKRHIDRLQAAIRVFEKNKKAGEPWPGEQIEGKANAVTN